MIAACVSMLASPGMELLLVLGDFVWWTGCMVSHVCSLRIEEARTDPPI